MDRARRLVLLWSLVAGSTGCRSAFCDDDCDSTSTPIQGEASMFTLSGHEAEGYRVGELDRCSAEQTWYVAVVGTGIEHAGLVLDGGCRALAGADVDSDCAVTVNSWTAELRDRLEARGVTDQSTGVGTVCAAQDLTGVATWIYDFGDADAAATAMGEVLRDDGLGDTGYLIIGPKARPCPDTACGW